MSEELKAGSLLQMATTIVAAHVSKSSVPAADIPKMLSDIYQALSGLAGGKLASAEIRSLAGGECRVQLAQGAVGRAINAGAVSPKGSHLRWCDAAYAQFSASLRSGYLLGIVKIAALVPYQTCMLAAS